MKILETFTEINSTRTGTAHVLRLFCVILLCYDRLALCYGVTELDLLVNCEYFVLTRPATTGWLCVMEYDWD